MLENGLNKARNPKINRPNRSEIKEFFHRLVPMGKGRLSQFSSPFIFSAQQYYYNSRQLELKYREYFVWCHPFSSRG